MFLDTPPIAALTLWERDTSKKQVANREAFEQWPLGYIGDAIRFVS
jgi:hypothetical protein